MPSDLIKDGVVIELRVVRWTVGCITCLLVSNLLNILRRYVLLFSDLNLNYEK